MGIVFLKSLTIFAQRQISLKQLLAYFFMHSYLLEWVQVYLNI